MVILVAHLNRALRYLPPAKYIPVKKNRCAIIIKIGPPIIINIGNLSSAYWLFFTAKPPSVRIVDFGGILSLFK
jgi:hypothetical protein